MNTFEIIVLTAGTVFVAVSVGVIAWRELWSGGEISHAQGWRDLLGIIVSLGGVAVLIVCLWSAL